MNKDNIPAIRFAGFTDPWEQRKLSDITFPSGEKNKDNLPYESYSITNESGFVPQDEKFENGGTMRDADKRMYYIVSPQSFAYNPARINVGSIGYQNTPKNVIVSSLYEVFKTTNEVDDRFLWHWFKSDDFQKLIVQLQEGGVRLYFYYDKLCMGSIALPNLEEQRQIGRYLDTLDRLITLHQRKYESLMQIKKSMLRKMFPCEGSRYPEVRFAGFTDAWEQRKFSELYEKSSEKNDGSVGIDKNITVATMQFKPDVRVTSDDYLKTYYTFNLGDIAFEGHQSKEFRYGRFVENDIGNGIVSHIFAVFRPIADYDLGFWKYAIHNEKLMQGILSRSTKASTMMHDLVSDDFLNESFLVPPVDEQKKIGCLLSQIDNLITLHQRKYESLIKLKKAFLQALYIDRRSEHMTYESEPEFERVVIQRLANAGWVNHSTGKPEILRYKTEKKLIANWADILFENNNTIDRLNDAPLTDGEMKQILDQIKSLRTPVNLNRFINGKFITIKRDNPDDTLHFGKEISLKIYDRQEIAGGQSRYQIAEQPIFPAKNDLLNSRRGDFMLLINGMPVIHVELKKSGIPVSQACYQIEKYAAEGVFTGLFSLVQVFVAMTPEEMLYYANPGPDAKFNPAFYFHWADVNNEPINNWERLVSEFLSIPMAHQIIGFYTVADTKDNTLKVMRSYQYYAASKIWAEVAKRRWDEPNQRGGYIWHTTGSGKTLTSFKSAQLIANSGDADKVIFLMDRIELGTQSYQEYQGFADDSESVQQTENTGALVAKLKSSNPNFTLIVTSIQKMSRVVEEEGYKQHDIEMIRRKRLVIIVDECHRDTFGEMLLTIKNTFPNAMFFGFSGTPIQDENQKKHSTTADVFGDELHRYTIADGIRDGNVLGFDPTMVLTYQDNDIRTAVALDKAKAKDLAAVFADPKKQEVFYYYMDASKVPMAGYYDSAGVYVKGIEDFLPSSQYDDDTQGDKHRRAVVEDIRSHWLLLSRNGKFHAILATSSIPEAIAYYRLFKNEVPEIRAFPLFDPNIDNNPNAIFKENGLLEILTDYNATFDVHFTIPTYAAYKKDVSNRLAHKTPYSGIESDPSKIINLLIVVDQMLTGFDSKWVNTLYLDKILQQENLIQAFSRTNRLFAKDEKPFGMIRYYRKPHTMHRHIEIAIANYSGNKPFGIFVSKLGNNLKKMNFIYDEIVSLFEEAGLSDFEKLPDDTASRASFAKLFRQLNDHLEAALIQGFTWEKAEYKDEKTDETILVKFNETTYLTLVLRYKELFQGGGGVKVDDLPYEIDPHLTEINTGTIDKNYMESRFRKFLRQLQDGVETTDALIALHKSFAVLTQEQQKYARIFLTDVQQGKIQVSDEKTLIDYINQYQSEAQNDRIHRFAESIGVDEALLRSMINRNLNESNINEFGLFDQLKASVDRSKAKEYLEKRSGKSIKPFRIPAEIDVILRKFILNEDFDEE